MKLFLLIIALAIPVLAEDSVEQRLAAKDAEIAALHQYIDETVAWYMKANATLSAAWNACIGPPPQKPEAAKAPQRPTQNPDLPKEPPK